MMNRRRLSTGVALLGVMVACSGCSSTGGEPNPGKVGGSQGSGGDATSSGGDGATGGSATGGHKASGGDTSSSGGLGGGLGGNASGGSDGGSGGGSGGVVNPFDEHPPWVFTCASDRSAASCGFCLDAKCVFCMYATPEEREEYNATHEGLAGCGTPDPVECVSGCSFTVSRCPPCAQP